MAIEYDIKVEREFPVDMGVLDGVLGFLEEELENLKCPLAMVMKFNIAIDEIVSNIIRYSGASFFKVSVAEGVGKWWVIFTDNGKEWNPLQHEDPDITLSAEDRSIGGLGIMLVKKLMDEVSYVYIEGKNQLVIGKGA